MTLVNYNSHIYFIYISKSKLVDGRHCTKAAACPPGMSVLPNVFGILLYYSTARLHNLTAFVHKYHVIIRKIISFPEWIFLLCSVMLWSLITLSTFWFCALSNFISIMYVLYFYTHYLLRNITGMSTGARQPAWRVQMWLDGSWKDKASWLVSVLRVPFGAWTLLIRERKASYSLLLLPSGFWLPDLFTSPLYLQSLFWLVRIFYHNITHHKYAFSHLLWELHPACKKPAALIAKCYFLGTKCILEW